MTIRVLLVDDTPQLRKLLGGALERSGRYTVVGEAEDGAQGISAAATLIPDLIMLDLSMPVMSGLDALPRLRALLPQTVIVVFTGVEQIGMRDRLRDAGADGFIEKGTPLAELLPMIDSFFSHAQS
jgi:DNA-binding NarL/FixJ family response regulator